MTPAAAAIMDARRADEHMLFDLVVADWSGTDLAVLACHPDTAVTDALAVRDDLPPTLAAAVATRSALAADLPADYRHLPATPEQLATLTGLGVPVRR